MLRVLKFVIFLLVLMIGLRPGPSMAGTVLDKIEETGVMVSATDPGWPPYSWLNENGEYEGFDIDVANEVARRLGVKIEFVTPTWDEQTAGNWGGKWDISIGSMTPTAERAKHLVFPAVYAYSLAVVAVHADNETIVRPADASGKRTGVINSSVYEMYLRRQDMGILDVPQLHYVIDDRQIVEFDSADEVYHALLEGDGVVVDAILDELVVIMKLINEGKPLKVIGAPIFATSSAVAIEPGDQEFADEIHRTIEEMKSDGTLQAFAMNWFNYDITAWQ